MHNFLCKIESLTNNIACIIIAYFCLNFCQLAVSVSTLYYACIIISHQWQLSEVKDSQDNCVRSAQIVFSHCNRRYLRLLIQFNAKKRYNLKFTLSQILMLWFKLII